MQTNYYCYYYRWTKKHNEKITAIKHLQMNQILVLNNPEEVDIPFNKPNQIKLADYNPFT